MRLLLMWIGFGLGFMSLAAQAQSPAVTGIDRFELQAFGQGIRLEVTLQAGFTCNGIQILRGTDSLDQRTVGLIGGLCGDEAAAVTYSYFDSLRPDGRRYYYSLLLGGRIPSATRSIQLFDLATTGFAMWPNPAQATLQLRWENEGEQLFEISLLGAAGQPVMRWESRGNAATLELAPLQAGGYLVRLHNRATGESWHQQLVHH